MTRSHARTYSGGVMPCSGNITEEETCCVSPNLTITFEECFDGCASSMSGQHPFRAQNVFEDNVPETSLDHWWMGEAATFPQKFRISLSCPKTITSVSMRNSGPASDAARIGPPWGFGTKDFEVKVRQPNSNQWMSFVTGNLSNPNTISPPLETFNGNSISVEEVEFSCLTGYGSYFCALGYLEFSQKP